MTQPVASLEVNHEMCLLVENQTRA
jgi:hypothetical protein